MCVCFVLYITNKNNLVLVLQMRATVRKLARYFPTAIVSGRCRDKVQFLISCLSSLFFFLFLETREEIHCISVCVCVCVRFLRQINFNFGVCVCVCRFTVLCGWQSCIMQEAMAWT